VLAGSEAITDIARFGEKKLELLRRFGPFRDGPPSHDHLGDILATLDAEQFQRCFVAWVAALTGMPSDVIAIDGKTSRRSKKGAQEAIHMVSAFAARQRLVLRQVKVSEKSNEIVAIPTLLEMLAIEGAIVTIDAMGCQRHRCENLGQEGRLRSRTQRQPRHSSRGRRAFRHRAEGQRLQGYKGQPTATMGASRPESTRRFMMSRGCKNATIGPDYKALSWLRACARSSTGSWT
jgi:predicted transposase YbfD/YdcC